MYSKQLFDASDVPLLYDVRKKEGTLYVISIPRPVYDFLCKDVSEEVRLEHFEFDRLLTCSIGKDDVRFLFDIATKELPRLSMALDHLLSWLTDKRLYTYVSENGPRQLCSFDFNLTSLAARFAPWTCEYFASSEHTEHFLKYAIQEMKMYYRCCLRSKVRVDLIQSLYSPEKGFHIRLPEEGVWISGTYSDSFETYRSNSYMDQFTFFVGMVAFCDALRHYIEKKTYLMHEPQLI